MKRKYLEYGIAAICFIILGLWLFKVFPILTLLVGGLVLAFWLGKRSERKKKEANNAK